MFIRTDDKISAAQTAVFLNNTLLGAGILTLPRSVSESVKTPDGWISVLLGGAIVMLAVLVMVKISQQFPGQTVFQYAGRITGRFIGEPCPCCSFCISSLSPALRSAHWLRSPCSSCWKGPLSGR